MRVLVDLSVLSTPLLSRGLGRYVSNLALGLHEWACQSGDLEVFALFERPLFKTPKTTRDLAAVVEELRERRKVGRGASGGGSRSLLRAATKVGADVIHSLDPQGAGTMPLPVPHLITCHHVDSEGDEVWHGAWSRVSPMELRRYAAADRVIAISRATSHELITRLDVPRDKISIVHHGVDLAMWKRVTGGECSARLAALGIGLRPYLLGVGAVDERKNIEGMFRGLRRARQLIGREDLVVVWAGRLDRHEKQRLRTIARQAGLKDAVITVGYVSDRNLAALYSGATALVFASLREGFGYPIVEAMVAGCPVITSNCSSLVEVAEGAALTVDPRDTDAIADAIVLLSDDNAERRRLGRRGEKRAAGFSLSKMVEGTVSAYAAATREYAS